MADVDIQWLTPELVRISVSPGKDGLFARTEYDPSDSAQGSFISISENHKILRITPVTGAYIDGRGRHISITIAFLLLVEPRLGKNPTGIPHCP